MPKHYSATPILRCIKQRNTQEDMATTSLTRLWMLSLEGQLTEYSKADSLTVSKRSPPGIDMSLGAVVIGFRLMLRLSEHGVALPGDQAFQKPALDRINFR